MTWVKLDDSFLDDPKFLRAEKAAPSVAVHMWCAMVAYCSRNLTDGFVPVDMLDEIRGPRSQRARRRAIEALCEVGLIAAREHDDVPPEARRGLGLSQLVACRGEPTAFEVVGYLRFNPCREEVLAARERAAELKRKQRLPSDVRGGHASESTEESEPDSDGTPHVRAPNPVPSRPVPSPVVVVGDESPKPKPVAASKPKAKRRCALPVDLVPNETATRLAESLRLDLNFEMEKFRDHHQAKGTKNVNWQAAIRTWLRNAPGFRRAGPTRSTGSHQNNHGRTGFESLGIPEKDL